MIICAGNNETFEFAYPVGVGLIDSAINLTKLCIAKKPTSLEFFGTAGSYGNHKILDVVESKKASNVELSFLDKNSYTPIENVVESNVNVSCETIINSSNYITTNFELAKKYLSLGIELENMEFYSVLKVAKQFNIPIKGIFVVTNFCNKNAHDDFLKNHNEAKKILKSIYSSLQ